MESVWTAIIAAAVGIFSTLIVQHILRRLTRKDTLLALRREWVGNVLDELRAAWSTRPFDAENMSTFMTTLPPRELRFTDPSAGRIGTWLNFRLFIVHADLKAQPVDEEGRKRSEFLLFEEHMAPIEPLLTGWALGRYRYSARAVERWIWASNDELSTMSGDAPNSKEMRRIARRYRRIHRPRP